MPLKKYKKIHCLYVVVHCTFEDWMWNYCNIKAYLNTLMLGGIIAYHFRKIVINSLFFLTALIIQYLIILKILWIIFSNMHKLKRHIYNPVLCTILPHIFYLICGMDDYLIRKRIAIISKSNYSCNNNLDIKSIIIFCGNNFTTNQTIWTLPSNKLACFKN